MQDNQQNETTGELITSDAMASQYGTGLNLAQVKWVGTVMAKSGLFSDTASEAAAIVKIMAGQELGLAPFAAMNGINIIKGRPTMSGNLIAAAVKKSRDYDYRVTKNDDTECIIDWYEINNGEREKVGTNAFTMTMAKNAGLKGDNWQKYPAAMLFNRAISAGQKLYAPDVFMMSIYTPEELESGAEALDGGGYIPKTAGKSKKAIDTSKPLKTEGRDQTVAADAEVTQPAPADATDAGEPDNEVEILEDDDEREIAKTAKPVDQAFKDGVKKSLDALGLKPQERMRLLKDATGAVTPSNLSDHQWRTFAAAIDEYAIEMADKLTENETKQVKQNDTSNQTSDK